MPHFIHVVLLLGMFGCGAVLERVLGVPLLLSYLLSRSLEESIANDTLSFFLFLGIKSRPTDRPTNLLLNSPLSNAKRAKNRTTDLDLPRTNEIKQTPQWL
jgi:hypothetical protein